MKKVVFNSLLIASLAAMVACDEEDPLGTDGSAEAKLGEYYLEAESIVSYLYNISDRAYNDSTFNASDSTAIWGIPVVATPASAMEFRFGNGITGNDGITRKGMIMVTENGDFNSNGSLTLNFQNFRVDDKKIGGPNTSMSISNSGNGTFGVSVTDFSVNDEFTYSGSKNITWNTGQSTSTEADDNYNVGGSFSGTESATGNSISGNLTEALVYDRSCAYGVVSGLVDFTLAGDSTLVANSGSVDFKKDDGCKNAAVITINTESGGKLVFPKTFNGF